MNNQNTSDVVRKARMHKGLTQAQFGALISRPQSVVSKYERGLVEPPGHVVMHCMNILDSLKADISPDEIARLVKTKLSAPDHSSIRVALASFIESISLRS